MAIRRGPLRGPYRGLTSEPNGAALRVVHAGLEGAHALGLDPARTRVTAVLARHASRVHKRVAPLVGRQLVHCARQDVHAYQIVDVRSVQGSERHRVTWRAGTPTLVQLRAQLLLKRFVHLTQVVAQEVGFVGGEVLPRPVEAAQHAKHAPDGVVVAQQQPGGARGVA
jgi:hypothetical protein